MIEGIRALVDGAKAEGRFRADRWLEDVLLHLEGHFRLVHGRTERAVAASTRWYELTVEALAMRSTVTFTEGFPPQEPATVIAVREAYRSRLRGEGDTTSRLPSHA